MGGRLTHCIYPKTANDKSDVKTVEFTEINEADVISPKENGGHYVHPDSPLTYRELFRLKKSWKGIQRHLIDSGKEMFIKLFTDNENLQFLFKDFKELQASDLRESETFEHHSTLVMSTIDDAISNFDNMDYVQDLLGNTGCTHTKFIGFQPDLFLNMEQPFLSAVKITLGDAYTESMQEIYKLTIHFILHKLRDAWHDGARVKKEQSENSNIGKCPVAITAN